MKIIDRLPFADRPHVLTVRGEAVDVYRNQIIVWISIADVQRPLPAILDTGHGHNLSIGEGQLKRWSGASLKRIGELEVGHQRVVQYALAVRGLKTCLVEQRFRATATRWTCRRVSPSSKRAMHRAYR